MKTLKCISTVDAFLSIGYKQPGFLGFHSCPALHPHFLKLTGHMDSEIARERDESSFHWTIVSHIMQIYRYSFHKGLALTTWKMQGMTSGLGFFEKLLNKWLV